MQKHYLKKVSSERRQEEGEEEKEGENKGNSEIIKIDSVKATVLEVRT